MIVTTLLAVIYVSRSGILPLWATVLIALPIGAIELAFLGANLTKVFDGGYVPVALALVVAGIMVSWWRGNEQIEAKAARQSVALDSLIRSVTGGQVGSVPGTAFYLTPDRTTAPSALLHSLKHFRVLHDKVVLLTVETLRTPVALPEERIMLEKIDSRFSRLVLRFGFMEAPNVAQGIAQARRSGLKFDVMTSTFILGRKRPMVAATLGLGPFMDRIYAQLTRVAADPTDYYHLPRDRVVELGYRLAV